MRTFKNLEKNFEKTSGNPDYDTVNYFQFNLQNFDGLQDIFENVKKSKNSTQIIVVLAGIFLSILLLGCILGRVTKRAIAYQQLKVRQKYILLIFRQNITMYFFRYTNNFIYFSSTKAINFYLVTL